MAKQPDALRDALAPYVNIPTLRRLAAHDATRLREALITPDPPADVLRLIDALAALLRPQPREQMIRPDDIAALLMVEMGQLAQEQVRVVCLTTRNQIQTIQLLYQGALNHSPVRITEFFREAIRRNSAAIVVVHNHPSGDPTPSPTDALLTRELVTAGRLLNIDVIDHLIIGQGRWTSLRARGLGFQG